MDDETVVLDFVADVAEAVAEVDHLKDSAEGLAAAAKGAQAELDGMRDGAAEAGAAAQELAGAAEEAKASADGLRDSAAEAGAAEGSLRDHLAEAAAAAGMYRDEMGRLRDAQGRFVAESVLEDLALGRSRDDALEAAAAFRALKDEKRAASDAGMLGGLFGKGGILGSGGAAGSIPMGSGLMSLPAMLAIVPIVEALLPEVVGLVSGFAAAGAGAVGFGLLAAPAFKSVSGAYQQIQADQKAYDRALTATAKSNALKHLQQDYAGLSGPQKEALSGVQGLVSEYHKLSDAFTPEAFKVFNGFLKLANEVLPDVTPFAKTFADALSGLLGKASQFAGSKGFKDWLAQFHSLEGPAITAIGNGIGKVAGSVGKLLTAMSSKDVVNAINIAFTILSGTIDIVTGMLKRLMDNWDGMSVAVKHSWYDIKRWTDDVTHVFDVLRHAAAEFGHDWASAFDKVRHTVASWGHDVAHDFDVVRHGAATVAHDIAHYWDDVRHAVAVLGHDIASGFDKVRHTLASWADDVKKDVDKVINWFKGVPGGIVHALGNLRGLLLNAGKAVLEGFLDGLRTAWNDVTGFVSGIAGWIASHKGPIEVDRQLLVPHGHAMIAGLIDGIRGHMPALRDALAEVSGTVTGSALAAGAVAPAGSTSVHVNIPVTATGTAAGVFQSPEYQQALQRAVQEVTLRYGQLNVSNGLTPAWGR